MFRLPKPKGRRAEGLFVDIGERDLFCVDLEDAVVYDEIYRSRSSVLVRATLKTSEDIVVRVSWSV